MPFQGLILIGQVLPKLWPFIYQTNDRTRCYDVTIDVTIPLLFFFLIFARTATHVRARESEGTACVVVVSGMRFESFFFVFFCTATHVLPRMYGHALVYMDTNKHNKIANLQAVPTPRKVFICPIRTYVTLRTSPGVCLIRRVGDC